MPSVRVSSVRQLINDGNHNAFTDLCSFRDRLFLTFRSCPDGHMLFTSSRIVVLSSVDGKDWTQVHAFSVANRDVRDPHLLVFNDKLFVFTGAWWVNADDSADRDVNDHLGFCAWSDDGINWHGPRMLDGTHGHYIWRAAASGDTAYLNGRRIRNFEVLARRDEPPQWMESWLLQSTDGFAWTPLSQIQPAYGDETALLFEDNDQLLAIARAGGRPAQLCRSRSPFTDWTRTDLDRHIGGPLLTRWGEQILVGGRKHTDNGPVTALYQLVGTELEEVAVLPSGGDNSYPGFVELGPQRALLSYYSSHEGSGTGLAPSAIYLATLEKH